MAYKNKKDQAKASKKYYEANKVLHKAKCKEARRINVARNRQYIWDYLKEHPCINCGASNPIVLEFDHLRDKSRNISVMVGYACSLKNIQSEIEKCQVLCANCHRIKTAKQFNFYKDVIK